MLEELGQTRLPAGRYNVQVMFDGFETVGDIWSGRLVGRTIRIKIWRHDGSTVPTDRDGQIRWLYARWQELEGMVKE